MYFIQGILLYSDDLLRKAGVGKENASIATIAIYLQAVVSYTLYLVLEKRLGVKKVFLIGAAISVTGTTLFTITNALQHSASWLSYIALAGLCLTIFGNRLGPQVTMHGLLAELTTAASRPTVTFYTGVTFWINGAIVSFVLPYSVAAWGAYAYIPFIVLSIAVIMVTSYTVPNTHNRTTAQIQQSLRKRSSQVFRVEKQSGRIKQIQIDNRAYIPDVSI